MIVRGLVGRFNVQRKCGRHTGPKSSNTEVVVESVSSVVNDVGSWMVAARDYWKVRLRVIELRDLGLVSKSPRFFSAMCLAVQIVLGLSSSESMISILCLALSPTPVSLISDVVVLPSHTVHGPHVWVDCSQTASSSQLLISWNECLRSRISDLCVLI
jgi:hypothetical protein